MADIVVCGDLEHEFQRSTELARLEGIGSVEIYDSIDSPRDQLIETLRQARAVLEIRGRNALGRETFIDLPDLQLVASTGPHRIDIQAATELGIVVTSTPAVSTVGVADHVCGLILSLARHIVTANNALCERRWEPRTGFDLEGKTVGILGLGRIGSAVAKRLLGFGVNLIAWGPTLTPERAAASRVQLVSEETLFRSSDVLSVHLRYSALSQDFVNASRLALMKSTALLIDISRAGVVNRKDLTDVLKAGRLAGAAMDLCHPLPVDMNDPILEAPRTLLTPHMAWQTAETFRRAARVSVDNILAYFSGKPVNVVNPDALKVSRHRPGPS